VRLHVVCVLLLICWLPACGGGDSTTSQPAPPTPTPTPTPIPGTLLDAVPVVVAGADVVNVDINVVAPSSSQPINAELLGTSNIGEDGSATSTGSTVHRGENKRVIVFGRGLNGSVTAVVSGPADIAISNIRSIRSENDDPGVSFDIAVSPTASVGARSVVLRAANNDLTVFTAGLEIQP